MQGWWCHPVLDVSSGGTSSSFAGFWVGEAGGGQVEEETSCHGIVEASTWVEGSMGQEFQMNSWGPGVECDDQDQGTWPLTSRVALALSSKPHVLSVTNRNLIWHRQ